MLSTIPSIDVLSHASAYVCLGCANLNLAKTGPIRTERNLRPKRLTLPSAERSLAHATCHLAIASTRIPVLSP